MATLAYPVAQSTGTYNISKLKVAVDNLKPSGKSQDYSSFPKTTWVLETLKPTGVSQLFSSFTPFKTVLDNNKLSSKLNNASLVQANLTKLAATYWFPSQLSQPKQTTINGLVPPSYTTVNWYPDGMTFGQTSVDSMNTADVTPSVLVTPYFYETLTLTSMSMSQITIANNTSPMIVTDMYNEKMLTIKTGTVYAFGELQRRNGWIN
jgi:hypothetical protein